MTDDESVGPTSAERRARMILTTFDAPGHPSLWAAVLEHGPIRAVELLGRGAFTPRTVDVAARLQLAVEALDGQLERADAAGARYVCPGDPEWPVGCSIWRRQRLATVSAACPSGCGFVDRCSSTAAPGTVPKTSSVTPSR